MESWFGHQEQTLVGREKAGSLNPHVVWWPRTLAPHNDHRLGQGKSPSQKQQPSEAEPEILLQ
jgi:hypothetical protein